MSKSQYIEKLWQRIKDPNTKTMVEHLGIEFTEITERRLKATMPVDHRTIQYYGLLHGGASVALAETLASVASTIHINHDTHMIVGLEINANHIKTAQTGSMVEAETTPIHIGQRTQIWNTEIKSDGKLLCVSRCTIAVIPKRDT